MKGSGREEKEDFFLFSSPPLHPLLYTIKCGASRLGINSCVQLATVPALLKRSPAGWSSQLLSADTATCLFKLVSNHGCTQAFSSFKMPDRIPGSKQFLLDYCLLFYKILSTTPALNKILPLSVKERWLLRSPDRSRFTSNSKKWQQKWLSQLWTWWKGLKAGPPLEAILVIFGRRALIFFLFESSWKKNEKWRHFCAHAQWWSPWRRKMSKRAPRSIEFNFFTNCDRHKRFSQNERRRADLQNIASDFLIFP